MIDNEQLRLWAFQWVMHGDVRDLPEGVRLYVAMSKAPKVQVPIGGFGAVDVETIELQKYVLVSYDVLQACRVGYGKQTKTFVVTPVETQPRDDLTTLEAQP